MDHNPHNNGWAVTSINAQRPNCTRGRNPLFKRLHSPAARCQFKQHSPMAERCVPSHRFQHKISLTGEGPHRMAVKTNMLPLRHCCNGTVLSTKQCARRSAAAAIQANAAAEGRGKIRGSGCWFEPKDEGGCESASLPRLLFPRAPRPPSPPTGFFTHVLPITHLGSG